MNPGEPESGHRLLRVLSRATTVAILAWLGLAAFVGLGQQSMIYFPSRANDAELSRAASAQGFKAWKNSRGETIGFRSCSAPGDTRPPLAVMITHGNAGMAVHRGEFASLLRAAAPDHAVSVYILEYPGYGARSGRPSQHSFLAAADEAIASIPTEVPLILLGESIGTGVACATAATHPGRIKGLLLLAPFDSLAAVARHHYPLLPVSWLMRDKYPSEEWLKNYHGPVAIILAANDTIVPAELGRKLHDTYAGPKKLIIADQADHNDLLHSLPPSAWHDALDFIL